MQYHNSIIDFLELLISSLKSGLSIIKSLQVCSQRDRGPLGNEISIVLRNVELGKTLQESLMILSERIPIRENQMMISAIINGIETGGNITEILENIHETIRKREELNREIKALTSQGVLSGLIVGLLPLFLVFILFFIDPYFIEPLFKTSTGHLLLIVAVLMEITGVIFIKKIVDIK
jgi:tight adherence protein B